MIIIKRKALMITSVASMIDLFNMDNIATLKSLDMKQMQYVILIMEI